MQVSTFFRWALIDSMWHHGVDSPSALMNEIQKYNLEGMLGNITTATAVMDAEAETRGQAKEFFDALTSAPRKDYIYFSAEEGAELHVQAGATAILAMRTFDWLDDVLGEANVDNGSGAVALWPVLTGAVVLVGSLLSA